MKSVRQNIILDVITKTDIETQEELVEELCKSGISITQATISRDIKELRLVKVLSGKTGLYKYALSSDNDSKVSDRFIRMFTESVLAASYVNNLIVLKTLPGSANVAGEAIDSMYWPEILGTLAGDNTVLLVIRSNEEVFQVIERIHAIIQ